MIKIQEIKKRSVLFTSAPDEEWQLNSHLIRGKKNNYIIDTGLGSLSMAPVKEYIKNDTKPLIVINTHYHWDHIWGNGIFAQHTIIAHKLCREMIEAKWEEMIQKNRKYIFGEAEMQLPNLVFEKELYFPEDKIRLIYTPGHTIDSISVLDEEEKVIHLGDNIGDNMEEIVPSLYCEKSLYRETLLKYKELHFDTCISGHNEVTQKDIIDKILEKL
jgi:glyoxylase-like metal-dependent hydrolase (beta-lactamase superfamily II)